VNVVLGVVRLSLPRLVAPSQPVDENHRGTGAAPASVAFGEPDVEVTRRIAHDDEIEGATTDVAIAWNAADTSIEDSARSMWTASGSVEGDCRETPSPALPSVRGSSSELAASDMPETIVLCRRSDVRH
jgi:hypothetical protein